MDLKSYTLEELELHLRPLYSDPESILPVTPLRLDSYLENPRAKADDPVLFEMHHKGEMVAYRTLLPDWFYDREDHPHRFAWLSGNWVRPDVRRRGISTQLLEMAEEQWQGQLMYTNYAPESKALYDHTGRFRVIANKKGKRFYLRSATEELLGKRLGSRKLLRTADQLVNQLREGRVERFKFPKQDHCHAEPIQGFDAKLSEMVNRLQQQSLFRRDREIFRWALENPWITQQEGDPLDYQFSCRANRFENILYHFIHSDGASHGILWLLLHNNVLSAPYLFAENEELHPCMAETVVRTMINSGCTHTTIRSHELMENLVAFKKIFLTVRKMPQLIFAHDNLAKLLPEQPVIHDGDGDVMFTG
ncbi:MAG: GNAT family N-acetyltransferase [Bacteroidales bacterium]|nr:GNAT family N-acetyltransferase [Bacteroidales bacterium]